MTWKLPPDWTAATTAIEPGKPVSPFVTILEADRIWCNLTRPQRELLLSCAAGYPVRARRDVVGRLAARGLITPDLAPTEAGRLTVKWRTR